MKKTLVITGIITGVTCVTVAAIACYKRHKVSKKKEAAKPAIKIDGEVIWYTKGPELRCKSANWEDLIKTN